MGGKDAPDYIFIDVDSKRLIDLLCDPWTAEARVAPFQFDNGLDEFG